jgi:hypothetical protein
MASRINQNWVFGKGARLDFSTALPPPSTALPTPSAGTAIGLAGWREGCGSISDASGQLVLYTDGETVWDGANNPVASGVALGLIGDESCTQSGIIVPDPGNPDGYYVFTTGERLTNNHVNGIRIDTTNSPWSVTPWSPIPSPPTTGSPTEKLTAIQHANCRDFWVLTFVQAGQGTGGPGWLRVFLLNSVGVQYMGDTELKDVNTNTSVNVDDIGYLKGSGDGKRIAFANFVGHTVMVYPFDNAIGTIDQSQLITIKVPIIKVITNTVPPTKIAHDTLPYGVEFSPNGKLLYFSVVGNPPWVENDPKTNGYIYQYDLLTGSLVTKPQWMHPNAGGQYSYALGALQRGVDDRIYIAQDGENKLGVIEHPDVQGVGCNVKFDAITLAPGSNCWMGLPNLIPNPCECACRCEEGNCDAAVDEANKTLNQRAGEKFFTISANGQAPSANCRAAFEKDFPPEFSLHWGDGPSDQFEAYNTKTIYIWIRNPFRNLVYRGVKIFNIRITPNQVLSDGDNALQLIPAEIVCFDEIEPCSHVSRDFAFLIQNAIPQAYQVTFDYCIEEIAITTGGDGSVAFDIAVVAS